VHGAAPHAARPLCGAPVEGTGEHVPALMSQAWHWPVHAVSQQKPSTQLPLAHSAVPAHAWPLGRCTHVPPLQRGVFDPQSAFVQQLVARMHAPAHSL